MCRIVAVIVVGMGRNQVVCLESGSFSVDQFYESVVCMREIKVVCIVNSCDHLLLQNMVDVDWWWNDVV